MVEVKEFISNNNNFITVEEIGKAKTLDEKRAIIVSEAYFEEYPEKIKSDGSVMKASKKLIVPVTLREKPRFLRLNSISETSVIPATKQ